MDFVFKVINILKNRINTAGPPMCSMSLFNINNRTTNNTIVHVIEPRRKRIKMSHKKSNFMFRYRRFYNKESLQKTIEVL